MDKDVDTGEWGLTDQIENSACGHIPDDPQMLLQRMEDAHVRQALDRGCDRQKIMDVLSVSRRTTLNKHKRACAYDFPLGAFSRGGQPTDRSERSPMATDTVEDDGEEQQRFDAILDQDPDSLDRPETVATTESSPEAWGSNESGADTEQAVSEDNADKDLRVYLQHAIDALQEVEQAL